MAFSVTWTKETSGSSFSVSGSISDGRSKINQSMTRTFLVLTSATDFHDVNEVEVGCLSSLPVVNRSTWASPDGGLYMPFAVCRSKSVSRNSSNPFLFEVTCEYETGDSAGEQCASVPPATISEIAPVVTANIGSYDRAMYTDKDGKQCWQFEGTGTPFSNPVMEKIPTLQLVIEQFEASITFEQMLERSFKTNSSTYRNKGAGLWMIGTVKAVEQTVQLAGGEANVVKVTYPVALSERFFYPPGKAVADGNKVVYGHETVVPLVDTSYVDDAGDVLPYLSEPSGKVVSGYINKDGTKREAAADIDKRPDYLRFKALGEINFGSFLQA